MKRTMIWLALSGLLVLAACSSGSEPSAEEATVTETVEVAPEACLDALFYADEGFEIATSEVDVIEGLIRGYQASDLFAVRRSIERLIELRKPLEDLDYDYGSAKEECEGSAD